MKIEVAAFLERRLSELSENTVGVPTLKNLPQILETVLPVEIEMPPLHVEAALTSNLCFKLVQRVNRLEEQQQKLDVIQVASAFCAFLAARSDEYTGLFDVQASERGHLNISVTEGFRESFSQQVMKRGVGSLFSLETLMVQACHGESPRAESQARPVDWEQVFLKAETSTNPDVDKLLKHLKLSLEPNAANRMMLLALLGDNELSVEPYLSGLNGRENVPWFIEHFLEDIAKCLAQLNEYRNSAIPWSNVSAHSLALASVSNRIFMFRGVLFSSLQGSNPERLLKFTLEVISDFYDFYNDPRSRELIAAGTSDASEILGALHGLLVVLGEIVQRVRELVLAKSA